jgi:hypothetical protein
MKCAFLKFFLVAGMLVGALAAPVRAVDARFGFVGTGGKPFAQKFGLPYYALEGNYDSANGSVFSSVNPANDPDSGFKVLRKVAKLNVRIDALGQSNAQFQAGFEAFAQALTAWYNTSGTRPGKPQYTWYAPDANALAAAESLQIIQTIRREKQKSPAVTGTVWEIGNEPNFFPALLPAQYAALYANYHRIIKREDSTAKIAFGPLFIRETGEDLKPMTREVVATKLTSGGALALLGQAKFDSLVADLTDSTLFKRVFALGTASWVSQAFAALPPNVRPDYISLHVYPYDDRAPTLTKSVIQTRVDSLVTALLVITGGKPVWITEFGNVNPSLSVSAVSSAMSDLIDVFTANAGIGNLFYYKATGADKQLDFLADLGASGVPLTRLATDSAFSPANGEFSCNQLNAIGKMYYLRAVGETCVDVLPPTETPVMLSPAAFATGLLPNVTFTWVPVDGARGTHIQVALTPTFEGDLLLNDYTDASSANSGVLQGNTSYYWRIQAHNSLGEGGPWSNIRQFTTGPLLFPEAPVLKTPENFANLGNTSFSFTWNVQDIVTRYHLQVSTNPAFTTMLHEDTAIADTALAAYALKFRGVTMYWRVRGYNYTGYGPWSEIRMVENFKTSILPAGFTSLGMRLEGSALRFRLDRAERVRVTLTDLRGATLYALDRRMEAGEVVVEIPAAARGGLRLLELRVGAEHAVLKIAP